MAIGVSLVGTRGTNVGASVTTGSGSSVGGPGNHGLLFLSFDPGVTVSSIVDNLVGGNTFVQLDSTRTADGRSAVYWCENWGGGAGHTVTANFSGGSFGVAHLVNVTGSLSSGAIALATGVTADTAYPISLASGVLAQAANAVLMMCQDNRTAGGAGYASDGSLTVLSAENDIASFWTSGVGFAITSSIADTTYRIDRNAAPVNASAHLIILKEAAAGGSLGLMGQAIL